MLSGSKSSNLGGITEDMAEANKPERPASEHMGLLARTVFSTKAQRQQGQQHPDAQKMTVSEKTYASRPKLLRACIVLVRDENI